MAPLYEPLREGFREMNRMLTDRQTFNAQNKAREASEKRSDMKLASQLEDRAFNRAMQEKSMNMTEVQQDHERLFRQKSFDLKTDQFNDKQSLDEQIQARLEEDSKNQRDYTDVNRKIAQIKLNREEDFFAPKDASAIFDVSSLDPEGRQTVAEMFDGVGMDERGNITSGDGKSIQVSKQDYKEKHAEIQDLIADQNDIQGNAIQRIAEINESLMEKRKSIRGSDTSEMADVRNRFNVAKIKKEISALSDELGENESLAGNAGAIKGLKLSIAAKNKYAKQLYNVGNKEQAEVVEEQLKELNKDLNVREAAGSESGDGKNMVTAEIMRVNKAGNPIPGSVRPVTYSKADGGYVPPPGFIMKSEEVLQNDVEKTRQKLFQDAADEFGKAPMAGGELIFGAHQQVLRDSLMQMLNVYRKLPRYDDRSDAELAGVGKKLLSEAYRDYYEKKSIVENTPLLEEEREKQLAILEDAVERGIGHIPGDDMTEWHYLRETTAAEELNLLAPPSEEEEQGWMEKLGLKKAY